MTYEEELTRVVDYLRSMPLPKLSRAADNEAGGDRSTRADQAREVAQWLADAAAASEGRISLVVPDVGDAAVGDQVALTGMDLMKSAPDKSVLAEASQRLRTLRLSL